MPTLVKKNNKALTADKLARLQTFVENVKSGKVIPFKEKTERAKKNLKKAGLIK